MKIAPSILLLLLLAGCRAVRIVEVPVASETRVVERLVPVNLPADSALVQALFVCDSLKQVQLAQISELKSRGVESKLSFTGGKLSYRLQTVTDTVYLRVTDSATYKEVPIVTEVPVYLKEREPSGWQWFQIWVGRILALLAAVVALLYLRSKK